MKICQINSEYADGSTGKITQGLHHDLLMNKIDSLVIVGLSHRTTDSRVYGVSNKIYNKLVTLYRRLTGNIYGGAFISTARIIWRIRREKIDIAHIQCINEGGINIYWLLNYLSKARVRTVVTLHAEFMYTGNCGHAYECEGMITGCNCSQEWRKSHYYLFDRTYNSWLKMKCCFEKFDKNYLFITSVSPWLEARARRSPFFENYQLRTVFNAVNTSVMKPTHFVDILEQYNLKGKKILLHITADFKISNELKGGRYIIEIAKRLEKSGIIVVVAANYWDSFKYPENLLFLGKISNANTLAALYSMSNLTVIVSKRETFNMPTAESLCCGTPVVGFKAGGPESIAITDYSQFVEYGDVDALLVCILSWIDTKNSNQHYQEEQISRKAHTRYSQASITQEYLRIYNEGFLGQST